MAAGAPAGVPGVVPGLLECRAVNSPTRRPWWLFVIVIAVAIAATYADALRTGFLNDDFLFLEEARTRPLASTLVEMGPLGNYYRPVSRQLYFEVLTPIAGGHPAVFHAVNGATFAVALALLADLLLAFTTPAGAAVGVLYFALLPFQRVNLTWVSCSQDLLALAFTLAAFALYRRRRDAPAALAYLLAVFSKESALPLPLALAAWSWWGARDGRAIAWRRVLPFAAVALAWVGVNAALYGRTPGSRGFLDFDPSHFAAGLVHGLQCLLGLDHPAAVARLLDHLPPPLPLALFSAGAWWFVHPRAADGTPAAPGAPGAPAARWRRFALAWFAAFALVTGPVAATWSSYYYTLAAVAGALVAGRLGARISAFGWIVTAAGLLWWHVAMTAAPAFAIVDRPWGWTSHLTSYYFRRAAVLTDSLSHQLRRLEPEPAPGTRFFFATLPPWAGFQMGNGALIRALYRDSTLESHFYSQFSDTTAADHPVRVMWWDGAGLAPLHAHARDPFFQVGSDLLLFDRPAGAIHAFRRGLAAGETPADHLYWQGWAELWSGGLARRDAAEAAWLRLGFREDSLAWYDAMRVARQALVDVGDTLLAKRMLSIAIENGIGRPEAHAVLGDLLMEENPKYALLELKVATWLKPDDWLARRELLAGLVAMRLDEQARAQLEPLRRSHPTFDRDTALARTLATLDARLGPAAGVAAFAGPSKPPARR